MQIAKKIHAAKFALTVDAPLFPVDPAGEAVVVPVDPVDVPADPVAPAAEAEADDADEVSETWLTAGQVRLKRGVVESVEPTIPNEGDGVVG